jgi:hypothetical protein
MTGHDSTLTVDAPGVLENDEDTQNSGDEGDPGTGLTANLVDGPSSGSLALNSDGSFTYTPNPGFFGTDSFTYKANDGEYDSDNVATVTIYVINHAPQVADDGEYLVEDGSVLEVSCAAAATCGVRENDSDMDGDDFTLTVVDAPSHGSLSLNNDGSFTYTPTPDYVGPDSFTYKANDGLEESNVAIVGINVMQKAGKVVFFQERGLIFPPIANQPDEWGQPAGCCDGGLYPTPNPPNWPWVEDSDWATSWVTVEGEGGYNVCNSVNSLPGFPFTGDSGTLTAFIKGSKNMTYDVDLTVDVTISQTGEDPNSPVAKATVTDLITGNVLTPPLFSTGPTHLSDNWYDSRTYTVNTGPSGMRPFVQIHPTLCGSGPGRADFVATMWVNSVNRG